MAQARQSRSAEQTAHLLLSNAFRYDSWECDTARREVRRAGGEAVTVRLTLAPVEKQDWPATGIPAGGRVEAVNLLLFDPTQKVFVGTAYRCPRRQLAEPLVFQAMPPQLLVVELLVRDTRPTAPLEEMRVTHWGFATVESLAQSNVIALRPGSAHLLLLDQALWPVVSLPSAAAAGRLTCKSNVDKDAALAQLMTELVPPGVFVPESFTKATPQQGGRSFRLVVSSIELTGTTKESTAGLLDENADWAVAAVAHNGYQQLGHGAEVPLAMDEGQDANNPSSSSTSSDTKPSESSSDSTDTSYGYSYDSSSSSSSDRQRHKAKRGPAQRARLLRSELPLEMDGLPVHAATSLVLAIRRRTPDSKGFKVVGFCVFPLCVMPMQNRDVRVENLPALRGPFSCEDARMLMVESSSPYGRVPIAMTVTMEYHDLPMPTAPAEVTGLLTPPAADVVTARPSALGEAVRTDSVVSTPLSSGTSRTSDDAPVAAHDPSRPDSAAPSAGGGGESVGPMGTAVLSTADATGGADGRPPSASAPATAGTADAMPSPAGPGGSAGGDGIFRLLCTIMEELQKVRETQDAILRQTASGADGASSGRAPGHMSPEMQERLSQQLTDGPVDLVDLAPRPLAVSWRARRAITDDVQPILHPTRGTLLDDNAPARPGSLPASLFGIRFEGVTLDGALAMPDDVCVMFSFGPLPYQQVGPMRAASVEKTADGVCESFKLYDSNNRGGLVWCEPLESLTSVSMAKYKECGGNATVYIHLYDALTMFYVATATAPLSLFHRPFHAEAAIMPMDLVLQRDFSLTEQLVPDKIFPVMRHAGQLHVSLFCVGVPGGGEGGAPVKSAAMKEPQAVAAACSGGSGNVIVARKLPHVDALLASGSRTDGESQQPGGAAGAADGSVDSPRASPAPKSLPPSQQDRGEAHAPASHLHWQRADYIKKHLAMQSVGSPLMPGVPQSHLQAAQEAADMEFKLRYAEKLRSDAKARAIAAALVSRMTVQHELQVVAWRPEVVRTPFQNPHSVPMQFTVDIPSPEDREVCTALGDATSFYLGPRERTEVALVVRLFPAKNGPKVGDTRTLRARIFSERGEVMRHIDIRATLAPPLVDRRYEIFGPAGSTVAKKLFSRLFSSASFPITSNPGELLKRMRDVCSYAATSSRAGRTTADTNAVLDPITQSHVTAWEEVTVRTVVPAELGRQRTEYVTLFLDADRTRVYETWELSIFACECLTTREIAWGQTSALGLPATGTEELYCDQPAVRVERTGASYVLRMRPKATGVQRMLLHTLMTDGNLRKTILSVPAAYPTPSFTQVVELSCEEVAQGPVFRRLTFTHRGDTEEVFQVHHTYKYQLKLSPTRFALAPNDTQFISLQLDSLVMPPGQLEGRWPMWIFINNAQDKTVESFYLQVVVRAHPVVSASHMAGTS